MPSCRRATSAGSASAPAWPRAPAVPACVRADGLKLVDLRDRRPEHELRDAHAARPRRACRRPRGPRRCPRPGRRRCTTGPRSPVPRCASSTPAPRAQRPASGPWRPRIDLRQLALDTVVLRAEIERLVVQRVDLAGDLLASSRLSSTGLAEAERVTPTQLTTRSAPRMRQRGPRGRLLTALKDTKREGSRALRIGCDRCPATATKGSQRRDQPEDRHPATGGSHGR